MQQAVNASGAACIGKRSRRQVMHLVVRFSATLAQDAYAVDDDIDAGQQ